MGANSKIIAVDMDKQREKKISKKLSYWLRHNPDDIGIIIERNGWTDIGLLISKASDNSKFIFDYNEVLEVVKNSDKQRFSIEKKCVKDVCDDNCDALDRRMEDGEEFELSNDMCSIRIRANQGHSIKVEFDFPEVVPPTILYHGAPVGVVDVIMKEGLKKMKRHHVHLSPDEETAAAVGSRRGKYEVLKIEAMKLRANGHKIYMSDNGVYLVDEVPPEYIKRQDENK